MMSLNLGNLSLEFDTSPEIIFGLHDIIANWQDYVEYLGLKENYHIFRTQIDTEEEDNETLNLYFDSDTLLLEAIEYFGERFRVQVRPTEVPSKPFLSHSPPRHFSFEETEEAIHKAIDFFSELDWEAFWNTSNIPQMKFPDLRNLTYFLFQKKKKKKKKKNKGCNKLLLQHNNTDNTPT
eukprot:TRINITY_DN1225_c0_g1_i3.p1 TRINITY_DN1225_c0_g1~~TRINITY_DN1225_c0_g1_i3.p1  ORF type:complete len:180 (-),score=36.77 TRINITY_DN1225_c0_g1_i3:35-574(-)